MVNRRGRVDTADPPGEMLPASISETEIQDRPRTMALQGTSKMAVTTKREGRNLRVAPGLLDRKVGLSASRLGPKNRGMEGTSFAVREAPLVANLDRKTKLVLNPRVTVANLASRRVQELERSNGKAENDILVGPEIVILWYKWSTRWQYGHKQAHAIGSYIHLNYTDC